MESLEKVISSLEKNIALLISQNQDLKQAVSQEKQNNVHLTNINLEQAKEVKQLNEKIKVLKIAGNIDTQGNKEVKLKINELVREIDKCITQINR